MRKVIALLVVFGLLAGIAPVYAAKDRRGASDQAIEKASDQAIFHRITDWFATRGKSKEEKEAIIAERKAERAAKRAQKEARKQDKKLQKKARKAQKKIKPRKKK